MLRVFVAAQPCGLATDLEDVARDAGRGLHHIDGDAELVEVFRVHRADCASAKARKERPARPEVHAVRGRLGVEAADFFRDRGWVELVGGQGVERDEKALRTRGFGSEPRNADLARGSDRGVQPWMLLEAYAPAGRAHPQLGYPVDGVAAARSEPHRN